MSSYLPGGTHRHYTEMANEYSCKGYILLLEYYQNVYILSVLLNKKIVEKSIYIGNDRLFGVREELKRWQVKFIHLHHFVYMDEALKKFLCSNNYKVAVTLHDYYTVCPKIDLTSDGHYCKELSADNCDECMQYHKSDDGVVKNFFVSWKYQLPNITAWRKYWLDVLDKADYVFVPSSDQRERLLRYFPSLTKIRVVENPEIVVPPAACNRKFRRIGILGTISEAKGRSILLNCARMAEQQNLNIQFVLFGTLSPDESQLPSNLMVKGKYKEDEVYTLINNERIDFFWFTAIWPETYSYVLTIPIRLGIPVMAADLGAIAERIKCGGWGEVYPVESDISDIVRALRGFDYVHYQNTGDFTIKNDHFLSFEELYCDDKEMFQLQIKHEEVKIHGEAGQGSGFCDGFADTDVKVCGTPSNLQPHELRYLWSQRAGLFWKIQLLWAVDKISLLKKIMQKLHTKIKAAL